MRPLLLLLAVLLGGCGSNTEVADLVVRDASVFDARTGRVVPHQTVIVRDGLISAIIPVSSEAPTAQRVIEAEGRLLTPGFIDVHHHTADIFARAATGTGGAIANLSMELDSIVAYRRKPTCWKSYSGRRIDNLPRVA